MVAVKHDVHQYKKVVLENSTVYRCMKAGCTHYTRKAFIVNKIAECPYCGKNYLITSELAKLTTLHCPECTKSTKKVKVGDISDFLVDLGSSNDTGE